MSAPAVAEEHASYVVELVAFCLAAKEVGGAPNLSLDRAGSWEAWLATVVSSFGPGLVEPSAVATPPECDRQAITAARDALARHTWRAEDLGPLHEFLLTRPGSGRADEGGRRRTQGSYYTPDCVVNYIVDNVVAAEGRPGCILDPACGGGAFLLGLYRALTRSRNSVADPLAALECIHGFDTDPAAVVAARRSLWLAAVQGARRDKMLARRCAEIVTKNVIIGDFLTGEESEPFKGQADALVGNPPYRRELNTKEELARVADTEFGRRYRRPRMDLWYYFVHRGLELLRPGGRMALIVNAYWTRSTGANRLIQALRGECQVEEIFDLGASRVFRGVAGRHLILTATKGAGHRPTTVKRLSATGRDDTIDDYLAGRRSVSTYCKTHASLFCEGRVDVEPPGSVDTLGGVPTVPLGSLGMVRQGIAENPATVTRRALALHGGDWAVGEGVFVLTAEELAALRLPPEEHHLVRPYHELCDLGRYRVASEPSRYLIESTAETCPDVDAFPTVRKHLARFRPIMEARRETRRGTRPWWQLHWPRDPVLWQSRKLVAPQMVRRPAVAPAAAEVRVSFSVNVFVPAATTSEHLYYLAAVLNSRTLASWFARHAKQRGVGLEINGHVLAKVPIRRIDFHDVGQREAHRRIVELVEKRMGRAPGEAETLDEEIDRLVQRLYA